MYLVIKLGNKTLNSPALSDTLVACSQVVRYFGIGNLLSGVAGVVMGRQEGFM